MKPYVAAGIALAIYGCTQPTVTGASRDEVIIRHDPALYSAADLQDQADSECARYGKTAIFVRHTMEAPLGFRYARFDCR